MTDDELKQGLARHGALIVHFSHHAWMDKSRPLYPLDLQTAIGQNGDFALSCSVVWRKHHMELVGSVGIVFDPTVTSVVSVCPEDSGSSTAVDGVERSGGMPLTPLSLEETFATAAGKYNEWRVQGAAILGLFVADPDNILVKASQNFDVNGELIHTNGLERISLDDVSAEFPRLSIFTMGPDGPMKLR